MISTDNVLHRVLSINEDGSAKIYGDRIGKDDWIEVELSKAA